VRHGLKNAAIPVITILGLQVVGLLGGAVIVEQVFAIPGIGDLAINAVSRRDMTMIQGIVVLTALVIVAVNLLVDVVYGYVNPRARSS
jgi:peptide/nickel transport system permease protein